MNVKMQKDDVHIAETRGQSQLVRKKHEGIGKYIIHSPMPLPEFPILKIVWVLFGSGIM